MTRAGAAAATALVAAALAGCGGSGHHAPTPTATATVTARPTATATPTDASRLQRALDARVTARAATALGVQDVRERVEGVRVAGRRATVRVRLSYRVRGIRSPFGGAGAVRARRAGDGRWRIVGPAGTRDRAPWEADAYRRLASRHFVVWMPDGLDPGPLPAALEDGYARMRATFRTGTLRRRYLVVVARDARHARRLTSHIRGLSGLTALTDTQVTQAGPAQRVTGVASQRVVVVGPAFTALDAEQQRQTVTHELTHAALATVTSGRVPAWLSEGMAMYVSGDRRTGQGTALSGVPHLRSLSAPDAMGRLEGDRQSAAYAVASAAAFLIADRYGRHRLVALYEAFDRDDLPGRAGNPALTDAALRKVLGTSLERLDRAARAALGSPLIVPRGSRWHVRGAGSAEPVPRNTPSMPRHGLDRPASTAARPRTTAQRSTGS